MTRAAVLAAALGIVSASAQAQAPMGVDSPELVIDGFAKTCRAGFPNFDAVARAATSNGFVERQVSALPGGALPAGITLPRAFQKGEVMMQLISPSPAIPASGRACQVTAMAKSKPNPKAFVDAVESGLGLGSPTWDGKDDNAVATWQTPGGTLQASITRYRRVRSYSIKITQ